MTWMVPLWFGLVIASWTDIRSRRVPNRLTGPLALVGICIAASGVGPVGIGSALLAMGVAFVVMAGPFALRIFKGGDLKLMVAAGAWLEPMGVVWAIGIGVMFGGVLGLGQMLFRPGGFKSLLLEIRVIVLSAKLRAPETVASASTVPMAVAFSIGVLWVSGRPLVGS